MVKTKGLMIVFLIVLYSLAAGASGSSLWSDEAVNLYKDEVEEREFKAGDVVTVIIEEDADAVQSANTSTSQDSSVDASSGIGILDFLKGFGFSYSDQGNADGQTQQSGQLQADITTIVQEVLPGGNLKIAGNKNIKINGEEQAIKLQGIIRPDDITEENTISSKKVAEASIEYQGQGVVSDKQDPGLLERFLNWVF